MNPCALSVGDIPKSRMEIEMKERNSLEESLPENSLWSSRDKEISGIWLLNKYDKFHSGFYDFLPMGVFLLYAPSISKHNLLCD